MTMCWPLISSRESRAKSTSLLTICRATFGRADLLVCRSGASTVGEITAAGKPAIFVPFPAAADDHQNVNARALERAGAAVVVEESNLGAAYLVDTIAALIGDAGRLQSMSAAAKSLAHPKAVEEIAEMVRQLAGRIEARYPSFTVRVAREQQDPSLRSRMTISISLISCVLCVSAVRWSIISVRPGIEFSCSPRFSAYISWGSAASA